MKLGNKAIIGIIKLIAFVLAVILLYFLVKNNWNVGKSFSDMLGLAGK